MAEHNVAGYNVANQHRRRKDHGALLWWQKMTVKHPTTRETTGRGRETEEDRLTRPESYRDEGSVLHRA